MNSSQPIILGAPYSYLTKGNGNNPGIYQLFLRVFVPRGQRIMWSNAIIQNPDDADETIIEGAIVGGVGSSQPWALIPIDTTNFNGFDPDDPVVPSNHRVTIRVINGTEIRQDTIYFSGVDSYPTDPKSIAHNQIFNAPYMYLHGRNTEYNTPSIEYIPRCCFILRGDIVDRRFTYSSAGDYVADIFINPNLNAPALEVHASLLYPNFISYYTNADGDGGFSVNIGPEQAPLPNNTSLILAIQPVNPTKKGKRKNKDSDIF